MNKKLYPSDITRKQFANVLPILESVKNKTSPRTLDLYHVFNAVLYLLKTGCQWRALPKGYPNYRRVHYYFTTWRDSGILDKVLKKIIGEVRISNGRNAKTSLIIIYAQSVKNTDTAKEKGYDAGKKVSGIKRHIAVDTNGLPQAIAITTANITDRAGAITMVTADKQNLSRVKNTLLDGEKFATEIKRILGSKVEVVK